MSTISHSIGLAPKGPFLRLVHGVERVAPPSYPFIAPLPETAPQPGAIPSFIRQRFDYRSHFSQHVTAAALQLNQDRILQQWHLPEKMRRFSALMESGPVQDMHLQNIALLQIAQAFLAYAEETPNLNECNAARGAAIAIVGPISAKREGANFTPGAFNQCAMHYLYADTNDLHEIRGSQLLDWVKKEKSLQGAEVKSLNIAMPDMTHLGEHETRLALLQAMRHSEIAVLFHHLQEDAFGQHGWLVQDTAAEELRRRKLEHENGGGRPSSAVTVRIEAIRGYCRNAR